MTDDSRNHSRRSILRTFSVLALGAVVPILPIGARAQSGEGKYRCTVSDTIYDPAEGDPERNIPQGTRFEDLPDDWNCPDCGATKADFEPME